MSTSMKTKDIAKALGLNIDVVRKHKKRIEAMDYTVGELPLIAHKKMAEKLKEGNMSAIKMVVDRVHPVINRVEMKTQRVPFQDVPDFDYDINDDD